MLKEGTGILNSYCLTGCSYCHRHSWEASFYRELVEQFETHSILLYKRDRELERFLKIDQYSNPRFNLRLIEEKMRGGVNDVRRKERARRKRRRERVLS